MSDLVTPGVVLRTQPIRESDLIVVVLTLDRGKVDCIARGARNSRKRFPGGLPVGARGELRLGRGRGSLTVLSAFNPSRDHSILGRNLEVFAYVAYLCELSDRLITGTGSDPATFARLIEALAATIEAGVGGGPISPAILRRFELGLLDGLGLLPALDRCGVCGAPAWVDEDDEIAFAPSRGGALCLAHAKAAGRLPIAVTELAATMIEGDEATRARAYAAASRATRRELRDLGRALINPQLRAPLRSLAFFAQIGGQIGAHAGPPPSGPSPAPEGDND